MKFIFLVFFSLAALISAPHANAVDITALRAWRAPDNTRLVLDLSAPVQYRISPDSSPARLIIDIDAVQVSATFLLPSAIAPLKSLRLEKHGNGQRLVIDTTVELAPKIFQLPPNEKYSHRLVLDLYDKFSAAQPPTAAPAPAPAQVMLPAALPALEKTDEKTAPKITDKKNTPAVNSSTPQTPLPDQKITAVPPIKKENSASEPAITRAAVLADKKIIAAENAAQTQITAPENPQKNIASEPAAEKADSKRYRNIIVAIDAGHGGEDPGAVGLKGTHEKNITLAIARELEAQLRAEPGITPVLTRTGDYFIALQDRRRVARHQHKADIFVSVHADAAENRAAKGASVFALSLKGAGTATSRFARMLAERENRSDLIGGAALEKKDDILRNVLADMVVAGSLEHSLHMGSNILGGLRQLGPLHSKHVEQAGFAVLKEPGMVSLLVETGFISNPNEEEKLNDKNFQRDLARAIAAGVRRYCQQYPAPNTYFAWQADKKIKKISGDKSNNAAANSGASALKNADVQAVIASKESAGEDVLAQGGFVTAQNKIEKKIEDKAERKIESSGEKNQAGIVLKNNSSVSTSPEKIALTGSAREAKADTSSDTKPDTKPDTKTDIKISAKKENTEKLTPAPKITVRYKKHRVKRGENLTVLAEKYHLTLPQLRELNQLNQDSVMIGQVLKVPAETP